MKLFLMICPKLSILQKVKYITILMLACIFSNILHSQPKRGRISAEQIIYTVSPGGDTVPLLGHAPRIGKDGKTMAFRFQDRTFLTSFINDTLCTTPTILPNLSGSISPGLPPMRFFDMCLNSSTKELYVLASLDFTSEKPIVKLEVYNYESFTVATSPEITLPENVHSISLAADGTYCYWTADNTIGIHGTDETYLLDGASKKPVRLSSPIINGAKQDNFICSTLTFDKQMVFFGVRQLKKNRPGVDWYLAKMTDDAKLENVRKINYTHNYALRFSILPDNKTILFELDLKVANRKLTNIGNSQYFKFYDKIGGGPIKGNCFHIVKQRLAHEDGLNVFSPLITLDNLSHDTYLDPGKERIFYSKLDSLFGSNGVYRDKKLHLEVAAHTDNQGSKAYNLALSQQRAEAVGLHLRKLDLGPERVRLAWFGSQQPVAPNNTPEGRAKNRRVEIKLISQ